MPATIQLRTVERGWPPRAPAPATSYRRLMPGIETQLLKLAGDVLTGSGDAQARCRVQSRHRRGPGHLDFARAVRGAEIERGHRFSAC